MNLFPHIQGDVVAVRVRRNWQGKLVLQVKKEICQTDFADSNNIGTYRVTSISDWRDANADLPEEVAQIVELLKNISPPSVVTPAIKLSDHPTTINSD